MKAGEVRREADCGVMGSIAISMLVRCPFSNATFERYSDKFIDYPSVLAISIAPVRSLPTMSLAFGNGQLAEGAFAVHHALNIHETNHSALVENGEAVRFPVGPFSLVLTKPTKDIFIGRRERC